MALFDTPFLTARPFWHMIPLTSHGRYFIILSIVLPSLAFYGHYCQKGLEGRVLYHTYLITFAVLCQPYHTDHTKFAATVVYTSVTTAVCQNCCHSKHCRRCHLCRYCHRWHPLTGVASVNSSVFRPWRSFHLMKHPTIQRLNNKQNKFIYNDVIGIYLKHY